MTTPTRTEFEAAALPPLPLGQKMGSATINGKYIELRMHDDAAMQSYARTAIAAAMGWPTVPEVKS